MVKKLINNPDDIVNELIEGFILINKNKVKRIGDSNAVARKESPIKLSLIHILLLIYGLGTELQKSDHAQLHQPSRHL